MKLSQYFSDHGISYAAFARKGDWSRVAVRDWAKETKIPNKENAEKIYFLTNGEVTPSDFYNLNPNVNKSQRIINATPTREEA